MAEQGFPGVMARTFYGFFAPAAVPVALRGRIAADLRGVAGGQLASGAQTVSPGPGTRVSADSMVTATTIADAAPPLGPSRCRARRDRRRRGSFTPCAGRSAARCRISHCRSSRP